MGRPKTVRLISAAEAAETLGMAVRTFRLWYADRFTDRRPVELRGVRGARLRVPSDELEVVVQRGWEALEDYREQHGRK